MRGTRKMGSGRMEGALRGLGDYDDYNWDADESYYGAVDTGSGTDFSLTPDSGGNYPGDPFYYPTTQGTPIDDTVVAPAGMSEQEAIASATANMRDGDKRNIQLPNGQTRRVVATGTAPATPDLNTLYKIGSQVLRYVSATNPQTGQPYYQSQVVTQQSKMPMLLMAAAAFFLMQ